MNILLDTHIILWALTDSNRLTNKMRDYLDSPENTLFYSVSSLWELALKIGKHPDRIPFRVEEIYSFCEESHFTLVQIKANHVLGLTSLKQAEAIHKDPFDNLLIAQAKCEGMMLMTHDEKIIRYNESCILAV